MLYISIFITFPNQQYVKRCSTVAPKMHNLLTGVGLILFPQCYLKSACSTNFFKIRLNPQQAYYFTECYILPHVAPRVAPTIPFVQLAQKLLLLPASPFTAIHAAQLCLYSPSEQGSALLLTCLAAPPARPYLFHGRMTVELLENTGNMLLYPFSIQFPAIYDNFIFFSACKISQYVFLLCNSRHYIPFRSEHIIPVCKPLGFFLVQCP